MQNETKKELHTQMWKIENPKDFTAHDREVLEKAAKIIRAGGSGGISDGNLCTVWARMRWMRQQRRRFMRQRDARLTTADRACVLSGGGRAAGIEYAGKWQKACKGILAGR